MWKEPNVKYWPTINHHRAHIIPVIENTLRARERVKLLFLRLSFKKTLVSIQNKDNLYNKRKFVIFATYPDKENRNNIRILKKLSNLGYGIIVVSNKYKEPELFREYLDLGWVVLLRRPFGRDFGCYKEASLVLYDEFQLSDIDRVIYMNDSIITYGNGEDAIVEHLTNEINNFSGLTENYEFNYHVGSFALAISGNAFFEKKLSKYWKKYIPISTRRYSIHSGEMKLTNTLMKIGYSPKVLFNIDSIKSYLGTLSLLQIEEIYKLMEPKFKEEIGSFEKIIDNSISNFINEEKQTDYFATSGKSNLSNLKFKNKNKNKESIDYLNQPQILTSLVGQHSTESNFDDHKLHMVRYRNRFLDMNEKAQSSILIETVKQQLIDVALTYIFRRSQIHSAASILTFMGAGIIKNDVIFRGVVEPYNLKLLFSKLPQPVDPNEYNDIYQKIISKGHPYSYMHTVKKRMMYEWGFV